MCVEVEGAGVPDGSALGDAHHDAEGAVEEEGEDVGEFEVPLVEGEVEVEEDEVLEEHEDPVEPVGVVGLGEALAVLVVEEPGAQEPGEHVQEEEEA